MKEIRNAIIDSTFLGTEDHGIFTFMLALKWGNCGQGFGGYALDTPLRDKDDKFVRRVGTAYGMEVIIQLLETLGIESWEKLPKTPVRIECDYSKIYRIGHLIEDKWFDMEKIIKRGE